MTVLTGIAFSPWSEKARWALDHHRIDYKYEEYVPIVGELKLRWRLRRPKGAVTVPVLSDGGRYVTDSYDIAMHADRIGAGQTLFPSDKLPELEGWNRRSEEALAAGRALTILRLAEDPKAARAVIPPNIPGALAPLLTPVAKKGLEHFISKYRMREGAGSHERVLTGALDTLSTELEARGGHLVGGALSYADIAMAVVLQGISPVDPRYMVIGLGGPEAWTNHELKARYPNLIAWRDALYDKHRARRGS